MYSWLFWLSRLVLAAKFYTALRRIIPLRTSHAYGIIARAVIREQPLAAPPLSR